MCNLGNNWQNFFTIDKVMHFANLSIKNWIFMEKFIMSRIGEKTAKFKTK